MAAYMQTIKFIEHILLLVVQNKEKEHHGFFISSNKYIAVLDDNMTTHFSFAP